MKPIKVSDVYDVTDPVEKKKLLDALEQDNPILSEDEIRKYLGEKV